MKAELKVCEKFLQSVFLLFFSIALGACSVKFVSDYDSLSFEETLKVAKSIDKFYGDLLEKPPAERAYAQFSSRYVELETDLRSLLIRNKARALNEESTQISEIILELWLKYKSNHKTTDAYSDGNATLDRHRFVRLFAAAANAERAKMLDPVDKNTAAESK